MRIELRSLSHVGVSLIAAAALATPPTVSAQAVAPSYEAASDVYQLIAENEQFRVVMATWKPGQRDAWHSHAGAVSAYRLTDCKMRNHTPDGKFKDGEGKKGTVNFNPVIVSHSLENIGTSDCQIVIVERK